MRWLENLAVWYLERRGVLTHDPCGAFGGWGVHSIRICTKWRYHTDSHAYEWKTVNPW